MGKTYTVRCKELDQEGRGIVNFNSAYFSVPYLLPEEKAKISLVYGKNKTGAKLEEVIEKADCRKEPECPYYMQCGGCTMMHCSYEGQLAFKQSVVEKALAGIFTAERSPNEGYPTRLFPILGMEGTPLYYRNKVHSTFARGMKGQVISGLYEESTHKVVPLKQCLIEEPITARIMKTIRKFVTDRNISIYNEKTGNGLLRHVMFRVAKDGAVMVVVVIADNIFREKNLLADCIVKMHKEVKTVVLNYNMKKTTMVLGNREETLVGAGFLEDTIGNCVFRLSPRSFYQVNAVQTERLYQTALAFADCKRGERVLDAFCGIGTITVLLANACNETEVVGVELNQDAVNDALTNARRNKVSNASFVCADAGAYLQKCVQYGERFDTIVMDPPRSGSSEAFLKAAMSMRPEKIVYVSCEPETFARDAKILSRKYHLSRVQPVDMFPQTTKVELVSLFVRKTLG